MSSKFNFKYLIWSFSVSSFIWGDLERLANQDYFSAAFAAFYLALTLVLKPND